MHPTSLRPLSYGEILDGTFTLYRRHFVTLFTVALATIVASYGARRWLTMHPMEPTWFSGLLMIAVTLVTLALLQATCTRVFSQGLRGGETSFGDAYRHGLRAALPLAGAWAMVAVLVGFTLWILAYFVVPLAVPMLDAMGVLGAVLMVALVLLAVLAVYTWFYAVPAAILVERKGPGEAIERSLELSGGAFWRTASILLLGVIIVWAGIVGVTWMLLRTVLSLETLEGAVTAVRVLGGVQILMSATTTPFLVGLSTLTYYDRRVRDEAYDLEAVTEQLAYA